MALRSHYYAFQSAFLCSPRHDVCACRFSWTGSRIASPHGRGRREAPGGGPYRLAHCFAPDIKIVRRGAEKMPSRATVPHPALSRQGEGIQAGSLLCRVWADTPQASLQVSSRILIFQLCAARAVR